MIKVDVSKDNVGWGSFLWVRVDLDLHKHVAGGRFINVNYGQLWIPLRYEKLPKIRLLCGQISHGSNVYR